MRLILLATVALAACSGPKPDAPAVATNDSAPAVVAAAPAPDDAIAPPTAPARLEADYVGRWIGVEGMYLNVTKRAGGGVSLEMQYDLDQKGTYDGTVTPDGLRFTRDGVTETLRPTDGDATGLKYLADKTDCLTVKSGEGYCRD